jgi:putative transposase
MPRHARVVIPQTPHHVIQRGNRRQRTFFSDDDYRAYLHIAAECFVEAGVEVWAYCLMPNHVHLIATPGVADALAEAVGATHRRYTRRINEREAWTGFLWQGRFASFPMDDNYLMTCARYVGLNPVRAGLVKRAIDWPWSSVGAHVEGRPDPLLSSQPLIDLLGSELVDLFAHDVGANDHRRLRLAANTGRPLGAAAWIKSLNATTSERGHARPALEFQD